MQLRHNDAAHAGFAGDAVRMMWLMLPQELIGPHWPRRTRLACSRAADPKFLRAKWVT